VYKRQIQDMAIPEILKGKDILASAQTGTGKTAAFLLPVIHSLATDQKRQKNKRLKSLILSPTRELAEQIHTELIKLSENTTLRSLVIYGGVNERPQIKSIKAGVDIIVATPGRLLDLANRKLIHFSEIQNLILDEADKMLDMGFIRDLKRIISFLPVKRQTLMFS